MTFKQIDKDLSTLEQELQISPKTDKEAYLHEQDILRNFIEKLELKYTIKKLFPFPFRDQQTLELRLTERQLNLIEISKNIPKSELLKLYNMRKIKLPQTKFLKQIKTVRFYLILMKILQYAQKTYLSFPKKKRPYQTQKLLDKQSKQSRKEVEHFIKHVSAFGTFDVSNEI